MSLSTRLFLSHILIVVICLGIAIVSMVFLLKGYRDQLTLTRLDDMTRPISVQIKSLLRAQTSLPELLEKAQEQARDNNILILFVDSRGNLLKAVTPDEYANKTFIVNSVLPHSIQQEEQGSFSTTDGEKFLFSAYPLGRLTQSFPLKADTLIVCQKQGGIVIILASLFKSFLWAGLLALIISLVAAILVSRSIYKPVRSLSRAAENISQGKYDQVVPISGPSEIKGLAKNFNLMAARIRDSNLHLRHFVADVSHQLKSPLTSIQGFAQAIQDGTAADAETRHKAAGIIVDESRRMIRQVNELLELSRMQAGQLTLVKETLNIQDIITQCQEIFALKLQEKKLAIKNDFEFKGSLSGDADRLEDVFCNLIDNAIKNTPPQGEIRFATRPANHNAVEISVQDTGPGIPPEQIPYVFDRFQQSANLRTGFGLGLAIAREIILAHEGKIEVISNPGEGAKFMITLPLDQEQT